jgi:hypothetical protein
VINQRRMEGRKSVMETMMNGLVRKMSVVFGRREEEVSEAVNAEMKEMLEEYKTWAKAMTTASKKSVVGGEKKEKVPKVPKEKTQKAKKAASSASVVVEDDEVVIESTATAAVVVIESATAAGGETEVTTKVAKVPKVPKAKVEKVPKEKAPKAEKVPKEKATKASKAAAAQVQVPEVLPPLQSQCEVAPEEEEEVEVVEMEYQGVKYLRSGKGVVYDAETSEEVGMWNEETQSIEVE